MIAQRAVLLALCAFCLIGSALCLPILLPFPWHFLAEVALMGTLGWNALPVWQRGFF